MEEISFSALKEGDLEEVLAIEQVCFPTPWTKRMFEEDTVKGNTSVFIVAKLRDTIIGYGGFWLVLNEAHLGNLAVHPQFRHQGIGSGILKKLIELARLKKATLMTLEVRETNEIARALYEKMGFRMVAIRKGYYQDTNEDAYIFLKELDEDGEAK
jgi:ribosomal-protein-alanine N-acetyltransferase